MRQRHSIHSAEKVMRHSRRQLRIIGASCSHRIPNSASTFPHTHTHWTMSRSGALQEAKSLERGRVLTGAGENLGLAMAFISDSAGWRARNRSVRHGPWVQNVSPSAIPLGPSHPAVSSRAPRVI